MQVAMKRNVIRRRLSEPKSSADGDPEPRDGGVQSVDRALLILETLAEDDEGYRLSDLSVRTGLSTSTVHRLLATLEKRRFVQFDRYESKWHVGAQSFAVGATFPRAPPPQLGGAGNAIFAQAARSDPGDGKPCGRRRSIHHRPDPDRKPRDH